ncbi:hypothetical protein K438DRAFT_1963460 [Mycena galopus ATCC 62051]|nr:hypothetical protein K438DRAFT_1963460 [Mycena galopus ATCC 62051]
MKVVLLAPALAIGAAAQVLTINTPTIGGTTPGTAECQPLLITWSGGTGPFIIADGPVNTSPAGTTPVIKFGGQTGTQVSWAAVNVTENTQLILSIKDATGAAASSALFPVTVGSDSCLLSGGGDGSKTSHGSTASSSDHPKSTPATSTLTEGSTLQPPSSPTPSRPPASQLSPAASPSSSPPSLPPSRSSSSASQTSSPANQSSTTTGRSSSSLPPPSNTGSPAVLAKKKLTGPVAGGVLGGLIVVFGALGFLFWRTRRRGQPSSGPGDELLPEPFFSTLPVMQLVSRGILVKEGKGRRRADPTTAEILDPPEEAPDAPPMSQANSSNPELWNEMRRLREQMQVLEQHIRTAEPRPGQAETEAPPEYAPAAL